MKLFESKDKTIPKNENSTLYFINEIFYSKETDKDLIEENHPFKKKLLIFLSIFLLIAIIVIIIICLVNRKKSKKTIKSTTKNLVESIELTPTHINGIAGENYTVNLTIPENFCSKKINLKFNNSFNLSDDELDISIDKNSTRCSFILKLIQYKATINNTENIIKIIKNGEEINETISLIIKNSYFDSLIYIEGPTEGNVINPPIITFTPVDKYGNLFNDIFSGKIQNRRNLNEKNVFKNKYKSKKEFLVSLTSVIFSNNNATIEANNYIEGNKYIKIQYKSFKTGNVKLTSPYFKEEFNYRIKSGPIDLNNSYIEIINTEIIKIGDELKYIIHLKDLYGNDIDDLNEEVYIKLFKNNSEKIKRECKLNNDGKNDELKYNILQCSEIVNEKNYEDIKKFVENNIIKCINCDKVTFKNYEKYISTTIVENNKKKETEKTEEKKEKEKKEKEEKMEKEEEKDEEKYEEKEKNQFENKEKDEQDKKSEEKEDEIKYEEEKKIEQEKEEEKYEQEKEEEKNEQEKEEEIKYEEEKKEEENQENKEEEIKNEEEKLEEKIEEEKQEEKIQQEKEEEIKIEEEKQEENQENIEEEIKKEEEKYEEEKYEQEKEEEIKYEEKIEEEKEEEIKYEEEKKEEENQENKEEEIKNEEEKQEEIKYEEEKKEEENQENIEEEIKNEEEKEEEKYEQEKEEEIKYEEKIEEEKIEEEKIEQEKEEEKIEQEKEE